MSNGPTGPTGPSGLSGMSGGTWVPVGTTLNSPVVVRKYFFERYTSADDLQEKIDADHPGEDFRLVTTMAHGDYLWMFYDLWP